MDIRFTKMHGLGNDYVVVYCPEGKLKHADALAQRICDRHFGVGADGLVLICPSDRADFEMRMYNTDGSESNMCGNAIRCVGKYVYDRGLTESLSLQIDTKGGMRTLALTVGESGKVVSVAVEMGDVSLAAKSIPVDTDYPDFINQPMLVHGEVYLVTCVSMGNPHAVILCDDTDDVPLEIVGPLLERHEKFPQRVNVEFVQVVDHETLKMRVWERGNGETFACGTGACASVVAAVLNEHCAYDHPVTVRLRGGELHITYRHDGSVLMEGAAAEVFGGVYPDPEQE